MVFYFDKASLFLSCLVFCCWHCCTFVESSTLWTDNRCEHFWSGYCFSVIMCVARCLLSRLLFAATTDFFVYSWVERLVTIILDNLYNVIVVYLYIYVYNIFSGKIPGWSMYK